MWVVGGDELVTCLVQALRAATALAPELRGAAGFDVLASHCADRLAARLSLPQRERGDWAIEPPGGCACELCGVLSGFLCDRAAQVFEWPLAEQRRRRVHATIDATELPVLPQTRRRGRPYTLGWALVTDALCLPFADGARRYVAVGMTGKTRSKEERATFLPTRVAGPSELVVADAARHVDRPADSPVHLPTRIDGSPDHRRTGSDKCDAQARRAATVNTPASYPGW